MVARIRFSLALSAAFLLVVSLAPAQAQVHGVPPSVTSFGFGGSRSMSPGVRPSVTSLGPRGFQGGPRFSGNGFFAPNSRNRGRFGVGDRRRRTFFGGIPVYAVPYYDFGLGPDYYDDDPSYEAGPTVFERHGGYVANRVIEHDPQPAPAAPAAQPEPVMPQPNTVLVFKDGHQSEIQNYAIVSGTLFDLSEGRSKKIQLADLDLTATQKANDDRGVDFQLPRAN